MAFPWYRWIWLAGIIPAVAATISAGPLNLTVVYPRPGQTIAAVDSTFIFGSVAPGARLQINGYPVTVHKEGGWLAFLPVSPGTFTFTVTAEKGQIRDSLEIAVVLPSLPSRQFDTIMIASGSLEPSDSLIIQAGDALDLGFQGTPYCRAFCIIEPVGDTVPLVEMSPECYGRRRSVFDTAATRPGQCPDSLLLRGRYRGVYRVPNIPEGRLRLVYGLLPPDSSSLAGLSDSSVSAALAGLLTRPGGYCGALETLDVPITVVSEKRIPRVVEFRDSLTTIRTGPQKGYLCLFQPAGIRAEEVGRMGRWLKLKLSENHFGWVPDTSVVALPPGTLRSSSFIPYVAATRRDNIVSVAVATSQRLPFRIEEDPTARTITIFLYGAISNTDWIRYAPGDSLITQIICRQPEPDVCTVTINLAREDIWGYNAYYLGERFYCDIIEPRKKNPKLADLCFVLDPGHGPDPGAIGPTGLMERDVNLAIALILKRELERSGAAVVLTRSDTSGPSLHDRPRLAAAEKADIYIAIHNNALPDGINPFVNNGVSTYYYHPHSLTLARSVQWRLAREIDLDDFGLYFGNLAVNRPTQYPAILVEGAFMMIPEQEAKLKTEKFQRKLAKAILGGVQDFLTVASKRH